MSHTSATGGIFGVGVAPADAGVIVVPAPWEATTSYGRGTARGPDAIHAASVQVDLFDRRLGRPDAKGLCMLPPPEWVRRWGREAAEPAQRVIAAYEAGEPPPAADVALVDDRCASLNAWVEQEVGRWLDAGRLVGMVGGDHASAYGSIAAHAARHPGLGVLHVDAHADLRVNYQGFGDSHASIMHKVLATLPGIATLVQVGIRDLCEEEARAIESSSGRVRTFFDADVTDRLHDGEPFGVIAAEVAAALPQEVYVSFDIDGLDPALCPHTGTPVPGGLSFAQAVALLRAVVRSGRRLVGFDLCEVAPGPAGHEWDANVGARMLYQLIGWALASAADPRLPS